MDRTYLRGEMYYADLGKGVGSEQEGRRPVVIIQNNAGNKFSPTVIVAAITTRVTGKKHLPAHYYIGADSGLKEPSVALLEQIRTIDKHRLEERIGRLSSRHIKRLNHALAISIGLIDPSPKEMTLCLCSACVDNFFSAGAYLFRRVDPLQMEKDTCTYCNQRRGFDYIVARK